MNVRAEQRLTLPPLSRTIPILGRESAILKVDLDSRFRSGCDKEESQGTRGNKEVFYFVQAVINRRNLSHAEEFPSSTTLRHNRGMFGLAIGVERLPR